MNKHILTFLLSVSLIPLIAINTACSNTLNKTDHPGFTIAGQINDKRIKESSGLAYSTRSERVLWTINDSGNKAEIYAINVKGERLGTVKLKGVKNKDWEDISSFKYQGKSYLLIADVGDNKAKRDSLSLHFIKEPQLKRLSKNNKLKISPAWSIDFSYEDGPRDCESVAVNMTDQQVMLLSKRNHPPVLYQLPLVNHSNKGKQIAKRVMPLSNLPPANPTDITNLKHMAFNGQPTAMDISQDGKSAIVLTYVRAYYFYNPQANNSRDVFQTKPHIIDLPYLEQAEAISFGSNNQTVFITSEGRPAPLLRLNLM